ncbi:hypothetical protein [Paenibacillus andongensis]|uniref:hypothetical protein n=1 Tax=Paenibacillus andongensis TaxID=2975482 RepID=UPI0034618C41
MNIQVNNYKVSLEYLERLFNLRVFDIELSFELSRIHYKLRNYIKSLNWIERILEIDPFNTKALKLKEILNDRLSSS